MGKKALAASMNIHYKDESGKERRYAGWAFTRLKIGDARDHTKERRR
jgi:hypothetical protein